MGRKKSEASKSQNVVDSKKLFSKFLVIPRNLIITSGSFILAATIGFSFLPVYEHSISEKKDIIGKLNLDWEDLRFELDQTTREYDNALNLKNHSELLVLLKANQVEVSNTIENMLNRLRHSILIGYHAAEDDAANENFIIKINELNTYEKLWPIFLEMIKKTMVRHDNLVKKRKILEVEVSNMEYLKSNLFIAFILINSIGLFIGILSNLNEKKTE